MRLKLDENLGPTCIKGLRDRGHDVDTVSEEGMGGAFDANVPVRNEDCWPLR